MSQYDEETFEPVEETAPQEPAQEPEKEPVEETAPQEEETPEDNWQVRATYYQSEADKYKDVVRQQQEQLDSVMQQFNKPKEESSKPPQRPDTDDPLEMMEYNAKLNEYLLSRIDSQEQERQKERELRERAQQTASQKKQMLSKLSQATKSPEKAEKVLNFFANAQNLNDPALFNVMYDAAMQYKNGAPSKGTPKTHQPPPPVGGGEAVVEEETPDDVFNKQLGTENKYRL